MGNSLLQLKRLQWGMRSYLTSSPERKVTNWYHCILTSTGETFFDMRRTQLDHSPPPPPPESPNIVVYVQMLPTPPQSAAPKEIDVAWVLGHSYLVDNMARSMLLNVSLTYTISFGSEDGSYTATRPQTTGW